MNLLGLLIFATLFGMTMRRGASDPVCGMKVDRAKAITLGHSGRTYYFCSEHCLHRFQADTDRYTSGAGPGPEPHTAHVH